jgi:ankyrin repeat protein
LTPIQYAIVIGDLETYYMLRDRGADSDIRTPVFDVHILHFAAALLRVDLLKAIGIPLSKASTTAICHSLLHIAALPFNWSDFEESAPKVKQSIHDERGMVASFRIRGETTKEWDRGGYGYTEG